MNRQLNVAVLTNHCCSHCVVVGIVINVLRFTNQHYKYQMLIICLLLLSLTQSSVINMIDVNEPTNELVTISRIASM